MTIGLELSLTGRRAIVTGAANGLGLAISRRLVAGGARVLLVDKDPAVMNRVGDDRMPTDRCAALVKDLSAPDAADTLFATVADTIGLADVLINNAAWSFHKPMLEVSVEEFDKLIAVNQRAPYFLAQAFVRHLSRAPVKPDDATIVNVASVNALAGNPNLVAYAGTKGALVAMARAMAVEFKDLGIRVNTISPAAIETDHTKHLVSIGMIDPPKLFEPYLIKRFATCEEISELIAYLCSAAAKYVNGANWEIDGGYLAQ